MSGKDTTVYMIGNAHIDPVWLWSWQEGFAEVLATCRSALDRMNEYPEFVFTRADAATYRWIEQSCPDMFEEIKSRVREGRWNIVGGWWEQPDCNIPSGESFVRHELYGKRYFLDRFGVDVNVGYNVDSFGHNAGLPQILSKAGIKYYVFMRPEPREKDLPEAMFWWEGPDGSRVLVYRLHGPYCTNHWDLGEHVRWSIDTASAAPGVAACFYGVGNHGGGPTIANIETIKSIQADPDAPNVVFGTLEQLFEHAQRVRSDFPAVKGDLQHHAVGCYSAHSGIKQWIRTAENALVSAEKFCSLAHLSTGRGFPTADFAEAWRKVLFNQFHDILAGTSLEVAYDDSRDSIGAAREIAGYEANAALANMACRIDISGEGDPFVVFNPHPHTVKYAIYADENGKSLRDETGRAVPVQTAVPLYEHTGSRAKKVFVDYIPPLGYRVYYSGDWEGEFSAAGTLEASETVLRNDFYRITFDPGSGEITQIADDRVMVNLLDGPAGAVVLEDPSDTWSHGVVSYNDVAGRFGDAKLAVVENGPVRATVRVESRFGDSTVWQDISLYMELPIIEFRVTVDWREKHRMLKYEFPLHISTPISTYDAAYAVVTHPTDGAENPGQKWVDVTGTNGDYNYGVSLINDGKYGFDVDGSTLRMSVLRSPIYAFHEPRQVEEGRRYSYMDQGLHRFTFALLPHSGGWRDAGTVRESLLLNMPPVSLETYPHKGDWPGKRSFGEISESNIDLCAIKQAEDGEGLIVRLYETSGKSTSATLSLAGAQYAMEMKPFELKTLRIWNGNATEVDLVERER